MYRKKALEFKLTASFLNILKDKCVRMIWILSLKKLLKHFSI